MQCAGTRLVYAVHQTLPSLAEVGLACETRINGCIAATKLVWTAVILNGSEASGPCSYRW